MSVIKPDGSRRVRKEKNAYRVRQKTYLTRRREGETDYLRVELEIYRRVQ